MKRLFPFLLLIPCLLLPTYAAEVRRALVMGVWEYKDPTFPALPGIESDVSKMATKLKSLGFTVTVVTNPTLGQAKNAVDDFGTELLSSKGTGLFYFSGHGCENDGKNYLIPQGTSIRTRRDLDDEALSAQRVLTRMEEAGTAVNLVFLDCCRNALTKGVGGLAPMQATGTFIGFATASAEEAGASDDGSAYTMALIENLGTPGLSIMDMHTLVTKRVKEMTEGTQVPFQYSGLDVPFALMPVSLTSPSSAMTAPAQPPKTPTLSTATKSAPFVNSLGMKFVPVPGKKFLFCMHETRVKDFAAFVEGSSSYEYEVGYTPLTLASDGWEEHEGASWKAPGFTQSEDHPVTCVSCEDARMFCAWLSRKEGRTYCLPTDHEWSCAAGIGMLEPSVGTPSSKNRLVKGEYPWGRSFPPSSMVENLAGGEANTTYWPSNESTIAGYRDRDARTAKVMSYGANALGIFDMGGNVTEWCDDWIDGMLQGEQRFRVYRGGSWADREPDFLLSSARQGINGESRASNMGFRVVLVISDD